MSLNQDAEQPGAEITAEDIEESQQNSAAKVIYEKQEAPQIGPKTVQAREGAKSSVF